MDNLVDNISDYEKALRLEQNGNYSEALELLLKCLSEDAKDKAEILFHAGWCCEVDKDPNKRSALSFYQKAAEAATLSELRINSLFRAGWLLMQGKEYVNAASFFRQAINDAELANIKNKTYQHAMYWYAVCVETQGCYIEAIRWYRLLQEIAPLLKSESHFREIICLSHVGSYEEALQACLKFKDTPPDGFDANRHQELKLMVNQERDTLERSLSHQFSLEENI